ncbi:MAG: glutamine-hydrolyzing carbamoyl-phosphate synthase small subunit [Candidatus Methanomethylophilaceae archaeon]
MAVNFLVLEDGTVLEGEAFGYEGSSVGEVVFTTGMGGYQEGLTDPSFLGQLLIFTYPLVGNYGMNDAFNQSDAVHVRGVVVREYCKEPSSMYGGATIDRFLKDHKIPAISGIDTRELVIRIRSSGTLKGAIVKDENEVDGMIGTLRKMPAPSESNLVAEVSPRKVTRYDNKKDLTVGVIDCGAKASIIRNLNSRFNVIIFPYDTSAGEIVDAGVDGVLISNGPGDPAHPAMLKTTARTVDDLASKMPLMGICYGSQMVALGLGGKTYKLKFGHRGSNQPVRFEGRVYITSQNHGYAVDADSLDGTGLVVNQVNINDNTVEGLVHEDLPIFTAQYHPEASPGPWDTMFLFDRFGKNMEAGR